MGPGLSHSTLIRDYLACSDLILLNFILTPSILQVSSLPVFLLIDTPPSCTRGLCHSALDHHGLPQADRDPYGEEFPHSSLQAPGAMYLDGLHLAYLPGRFV